MMLFLFGKERKMRDLIVEINCKLSELSEKGYVTPGEILEALKPIKTGYDPIPNDFDWPKMPENWIDTI